MKRTLIAALLFASLNTLAAQTYYMVDSSSVVKTGTTVKAWLQMPTAKEQYVANCSDGTVIQFQSVRYYDDGMTVENFDPLTLEFARPAQDSNGERFLDLVCRSQG
jgi:hypothetical protein